MITIGVVGDTKSKDLMLSSDDSCKSVNDVDSVSVGFAEMSQTFKPVKSTKRFEYLFVVPSVREGFDRRKKLVLKIHFKAEQTPKTFNLKVHEEQLQYSKLFPGMC